MLLDGESASLRLSPFTTNLARRWRRGAAGRGVGFSAPLSAYFGPGPKAIASQCAVGKGTGLLVAGAGLEAKEEPASIVVVCGCSGGLTERIVLLNC